MTTELKPCPFCREGKVWSFGEPMTLELMTKNARLKELLRYLYVTCDIGSTGWQMPEIKEIEKLLEEK